MAETTFTFFDSDEVEKTALAGSNGSGHLAPAAVLYDASGAELKGQKGRAASVPVALSTEDAALLDGLESALAALGTQATLTDILTALQATLAISAVALPLPSGASTAANQSTGNTTLASILAKLIAAPATEAKQDTQITAEQAILAKLIAAPATEAKQDTGNTSVAAINTATGTIGDAAVTAGASGSVLALLRTLSRDLVANIVLKAGSAIIGKVGIDQTTPGTTNAVSATNLPTTVDTNSGNKSASTLRMVLATDQPALTNAQPVTVQRGANASASLVSSTAYEASHVLKNGAGTLMSLVGYNSKGSAQFIQLYNSTTVPSDTAVPVYTFTVPATSNFSLDVPGTGIPFTTGIAVANSSTGPTKTVGSSDCYFSAVVI